MFSIKQKLIFLTSVAFVIFSFIIIFIYNALWFFSLFAGCISYVILMFVTLKSVSSKITQKIYEASLEQNIDKYKTKYDEVDTDNVDTKAKNKDKLRFLDLSKVSLGFELSFSLPRIFAFLFMIFGFILLVIFHIFYPIVYLFGVFNGIIIFLCYLFMND